MYGTTGMHFLNNVITGGLKVSDFKGHSQIHNIKLHVRVAVIPVIQFTCDTQHVWVVLRGKSSSYLAYVHGLPLHVVFLKNNGTCTCIEQLW